MSAVVAGLTVAAVWSGPVALADSLSQGQKLTASDGETGGGRFGSAVALSADGNTAVVGATLTPMPRCTLTRIPASTLRRLIGRKPSPKPPGCTQTL